MLTPLARGNEGESFAVQSMLMIRRFIARLLPALALLPASVLAVPFDTDPPRPPVRVTLKLVLDGLDEPTAIAHAGDGRLFLTLQPGLVVIVEENALRPAPFLDVRSILASGGEQGLLGLAFHPRYAQNGLFFVCYTDTHGAVTVARYQVSGDPQRADPASGKVLLTIPKPFGNHNGGQIQFGPDGYLYVSAGDGGGAGGPECYSQKQDSLLGKILRLDVDANAGTPPYYGIPPGNPFPGSPVWATGLRNAWRFSFDRSNGDLWIADVGQGEREEVDLQPAGTPGGRNFGWKPMEGSTCFSNTSCPVGTPACGSPDLELPIVEYTHDDGECSITGGYVTRGPSLPHVWGSYFFGDLCTGRLWTADRHGGNWRIRQLLRRAPGVDTFGEDSKGDLWLATHDGELFQIVPEHPVDTTGLFDPSAARFLLKDLHVDGAADRAFRFGTPGTTWVPVAGDWDGDGTTGIGLWDAQAGIFRLKNTPGRGPADILFRLPGPGGRAVPIAGDWDGDGKDTVGFYDPATSKFYLTNRLSGPPTFPIVFAFGGGGLPVAGDWDGDGRDSIGLYLPEQSTFSLRNQLSSGAATFTVRFGVPNAGWLPLAGDWDGDGKDSIGLWDPGTTTFRLRDVLRAGPADHLIRHFGTPGRTQFPLAGEW